MNVDEIEQLQKGQMLNTLVAEEIMGNRVINDEIFGIMEIKTSDKSGHFYDILSPYSEDMSFARLVIERMRELDFRNEAAYWVSEDRPDVICKAALRLILKQKEEMRRQARKSRFVVVK